MNYRALPWSAAVIGCLILSCAGAQQSPPAGHESPAGKALTMLGAAVPVSNLDRALAFYTRGLGMQATPRRDVGKVVEEPLTFPGGGPYLILLWSKTPGVMPSSPPPTQRVILDVPDMKALESQLKANGYQLNGPINANPQYHMSVAHLDDPDGNHLELVQRAP